MTAPAARYSATARLVAVERITSSPNGNPRFKCVLETPRGEVFIGKTRADAQFAYVMPSIGAEVVCTYHVAHAGVVIDDLFVSAP